MNEFDKNDEDDDESEDERRESFITDKFYLTRGGFNKLKEEFSQLWSVERPRITEIVSWAAGNGDRSENGDYIYGKKRLREIDKRLRFLTKRIEGAEVVDTEKIRAEEVLFGATVIVIDEQENTKTYYLVGEDESNIEKGKINWLSPLAKALFKHKVGDIVFFKTPRGERELEIVSIVYGVVPE